MSLSCSGKLSDVLRVLSEQQFQNDWNNAICASAATEVTDHRQMFSDAVYYCISLLRSSERLTSIKSEVPSPRSMMLGREMFEMIMRLDDVDDVEFRKENLTNPEKDNEEDTLMCEGNTDNVPDESRVEMMEIGEEINVKEEEAEPIVETNIKGEEEAEPIVVINVEEEAEPIVEINVEEETEPTVEINYEEATEPIVEINYVEEKEAEPIVPQEMATIYVQGRPSWSDSEDSGGESTDDSTDKPYDKMSEKFVFILEVKKRVVKLAKENPTWGIRELRKEGSRLVKSFKQLRKWEKQIAEGGTTRDKHDAVNTWTYTRFVHARDNFIHVTDDMIREWVAQASNKYFGDGFLFLADDKWLKGFIYWYEIRGNSNIGYFKKHERKQEALARKQAALARKQKALARKQK